MSGVRHVTVTEDEAGQRLDRWLRGKFPHLPQGRIERMCRKGELRVDGGRVKASRRLAAGETVRIPPLPPSRPPEAAAAPVVGAGEAEAIRRAVLYRDEDILVIDKPPGLPVQGGTKQRLHLDALAPALQFDAAEPPRLVHRLDKDTSGVLVLARNARAARALARAFGNRDVRKIYWAAVAGYPKPAKGTIRYGLVKAPTGQGEKMLTVHPDEIEATEGARRAVTDYAVIDHLGNRVSWVALVPVTGRTHQLRAHMAAIGHPIVGDGKYGTRGREKRETGWGSALGGDISRKLHLHARSLSLPHPTTGRRVSFTAPLPGHMRRTWSYFGWAENDAPADPFFREEGRA